MYFLCKLAEKKPSLRRGRVSIERLKEIIQSINPNTVKKVEIEGVTTVISQTPTMFCVKIGVSVYQVDVFLNTDFDAFHKVVLDKSVPVPVIFK